MSDSISASGRRRATQRQYSAEEQALNQISREAESRLAAKRAARAEAREIRIREIERQQKEEEEKQKAQDAANDTSKMRGDYSSSRRGSDDSSSTVEDMEGPRDLKDIIRDLKSKLRDLDDKYKKSMMTNAQLDNQKHSLVYQAELLKDEIEEQEESMIEIQRECKDKTRDLEMQKRTNKDLEFELNGLKQQLKIKDRLIQESGLVIVSSEEGTFSLEKCSTLPNGPVPSTGSILISSEAADILDKAGEGSLDDKLKRFAEEKASLVKEVRKLKEDLEEEKYKRDHSSSKIPQINGPEMQLYEVQREASKQIHEYKLKLQKAEQDITNLDGTVNRLETQIKRYKTDSEESEKLEDELKTEKRKLQRELREAQNHIEELQNQNKHLMKRLEKMKQARSALVNQ